MKDEWVIVKSKSRYDEESGVPMPDILCKSIDIAQETIKDWKIKDPLIMPYQE